MLVNNRNFIPPPGASRQPYQNRPIVSNGSFARHAARAALSVNSNIVNVGQSIHPMKRKVPESPLRSQVNVNNEEMSSEIDNIVESVTNATKRLSQISTNTNSSKRKSKNHVGPWRLGRTLGRGSTGRVRLAKHSETGQLAAVKIVPKSKFRKNEDGDSKSTSDDDKLNSPYGIEREIIIMKLISHQNIMGLYDVWENKGELYLVLEYVEGGELFGYLIKKGKLPEKEAIHYFRQIISGVSYCHQFNICHRDLKPENLLLDKNLNIKIADFGMAALELNQKLLETSCGSPHYASPEIVTGRTYHGSPSDVWSCGIILFALLTGHLPFDDENIRKLLLKVQSGQFIMPEYLSSEAKDLIWKMLKVNPKERISIGDILKHPLLKKYETVGTQNTQNMDNMKLANYYNEVANFKLTRNEIDRDLLKSLSILFHCADESSLISKLLVPSSSPEKVFYYLLYKYKKQHQLKERDELAYTNSKKKLDQGEGSLKRSKSTIRTTITNEDGSTSSNVVEVPIILPANPLTPKNTKKIGKSPSGQLQISASSSYRRRISYNNKPLKTKSQLTRTSSSKRSLSTSIVHTPVTTSNTEVQRSQSVLDNDPSSLKLKKRQSILPPLPNFGSEWLAFEEEGSIARSSEFAALYEEIFKSRTSKPTGPKSFTRSHSIKPAQMKLALRQKESKKDLKAEEMIEKHKRTIDDGSKPSQDELKSLKTKANDVLVQPAHSKLQQPTAISSSTDKRSTSEPSRPASMVCSLDPKNKRAISSDNAEILNKLGVRVPRSKKVSSKIYYSKSSTAMNLSALLKATEPSNVTLKESTEKNKASLKQPEGFRIFSSNYGSFDGGSDTGESFDFEMPTETEIATAIEISNGSNVAVGRRVQAREDSVFVDVSNTLGDTHYLQPSTSNNSIIRSHKKAKSIDQKPITSYKSDIRSSLFKYSSETKEGRLDNTSKSELSYPKVRTSQNLSSEQKRYLEDEETATRSSFLETSLFVDDAENFEESGFTDSKRVTLGYDDEDAEEEDEFDKFIDNGSFNTTIDTPVKKDLFSQDLPGEPLASSPLKSIQKKHFAQSFDGPSKKNADPLEPQRVAPPAPVTKDEKLKKSNWFTNIFSKLLSSSGPTKTSKSIKKKESKDLRVFESSIPTTYLRRGIISALELKRKEGTLSSLKKSDSLVSAVIPAAFAFGKPVKFEIEILEDQIILRRVKGSKKIYKKLINAMEFIIANETSRYNESN